MSVKRRGTLQVKTTPLTHVVLRYAHAPTQLQHACMQDVGEVKLGLQRVGEVEVVFDMLDSSITLVVRYVCMCVCVC